MSGDGLDPELDLYVLDNQKIREGETVRLEISIPNTRVCNRSRNNRRNKNKSNDKNRNQKNGNDIEQTTFSRMKKSVTKTKANAVLNVENIAQSEVESGKAQGPNSSGLHHTNQSNRFDIPFRSLKPIKITLCWYDPPAPMGSSRSLLMHDLDLVVVAPDGAMHWGNANSGEDNHSSGDSKKGQQRRAGDPPGSNSSFPGWAWADDTNPNEQISINVRSAYAFKYDFVILYLDYSKYYSLLFLYLSLLVESSLFWRKAVSYWVHLLRIYTC